MIFCTTPENIQNHSVKFVRIAHSVVAVSVKIQNRRYHHLIFIILHGFLNFNKNESKCFDPCSLDLFLLCFENLGIFVLEDDCLRLDLTRIMVYVQGVPKKSSIWFFSP